MNARYLFWGGVVLTVVLVVETKHSAQAQTEHLHQEIEQAQQLQAPLSFASGSVSLANVHPIDRITKSCYGGCLNTYGLLTIVTRSHP